MGITCEKKQIWTAFAACVLAAILLFPGCNDSGSSNKKKNGAGALSKLNIEKGSLQLNGTTHTVEKVGTDTLIVPDLAPPGIAGGVRTWLGKESDYGIFSTSDGIMPDGQVVIVRSNGTTWQGEKFTLKNSGSALVLTGTVKALKGKKEGPCTLKIPSSLISAGTTEFRIEGDRAFLTGTLGTRTYNQVIDLIKNHPKVRTIVEVNVPGSINDEVNMKTGKLLRKHKFNTIVAKGGLISSGGVDLFCAGVERSIEKGARVGVHSWSDGDGVEGGALPKNHPDHKDQLDYFTEMLGSTLGPDFYFFTLKAAPADGMHFLSRGDITKWKLETDAVYTPPAPEPMEIVKSTAKWGGTTFTAEKVGEAEESVPGVGDFEGIKLYPPKGGADYVMLSKGDSSIPDGKTVLIVSGGKTYRGTNLNVVEEDSSTHPDEEVATVTGEVTELPSGATLPVTVTITESQLGGGTSEIRIDKNKAYLTGELGTRTFNQVVDLIKNHLTVKTIVSVDVPGSVNDEVNMKTGAMLRDHAFRTEIDKDGEIYSGGVDLFCAGVTRNINGPYAMGVHSWEDDDGTSADKLPVDDPQHKAQIDYFTTMLGTEKGKGFYFYTIKAAPPEGIHIMTPTEVLQWGILGD